MSCKISSESQKEILDNTDNEINWKSLPSSQLPEYEDSQHLNLVLQELKTRNPIIKYDEVIQLKDCISKVQRGEYFFLQAGDCAESFLECHQEYVHNKLQHLALLGKKLEEKLNKKVILVARMAGQYAKPRSSPWEVRGNITLPCYRGDMINGFAFTAHSRRNDPDRLLEAYDKSKKTLEYIREYENKVDQKFYTSHESLHLWYESCFTKTFQEKNINLSSSFLWLGERTRDINGPHAKYLQKITNPIGIKLGSMTASDELVALVKFLNPTNEKGKIILITRLGSNNTEKTLPWLIQAIQKNKFHVGWCVDPMHGNTQTLSSGLKTRNLKDIIQEVKSSQKIHRELGSLFSGLHLESSPFEVTECLGGKTKMEEKDLSKNYTSLCDPRLNYSQAMELIDHVDSNHGQ